LRLHTLQVSLPPGILRQWWTAFLCNKKGACAISRRRGRILYMHQNLAFACGTSVWLQLCSAPIEDSINLSKSIRNRGRALDQDVGMQHMRWWTDSDCLKWESVAAWMHAIFISPQHRKGSPMSARPPLQGSPNMTPRLICTVEYEDDLQLCFSFLLGESIDYGIRHSAEHTDRA